MASSTAPTLVVWSIGHSTRSQSDFLETLQRCDIEAVVDIRRFPGSRRLPQFSNASLSDALAERGILYHWIPDLGGRRRSNPDSSNTGWRHSAFRAYADHVQTDEFALGLQDLLTVAHGARTAMMCAEVLWWRCHRRLIADVLVTLGVTVRHIFDATKSEDHQLALPARLIEGRLSYAGTIRERA